MDFGPAIKKGLQELKRAIQSVKDGNCCFNNEGTILELLHSKGFNAIPISSKPPVLAKSNGDRSGVLEDYANIKFWIDKQEIDFSAIDFTFKTFVTKNENFCSTNINLSVFDDVKNKFDSEQNCTWYHVWLNPKDAARSLLLVKQKIEGKEVTLDHKAPIEVATIKRYYSVKELIDDGTNKEGHMIEFKIPIFQFTKSAARLLSNVSKISETEILKLEILNNMSGIFPIYDPSKGGGGLTGPSFDNQHQINIRYTDNFFTINKYKNHPDYGNVNFGANPYRWLRLSAHEVGHIKHTLECNCGFWTYAGNFFIEYINSEGHDGAPKEIEAEIGREKFFEFDDFLNTKQTSITKIFTTIPDDTQRVKKIDELWALFPNK